MGTLCIALYSCTVIEILGARTLRIRLHAPSGSSGGASLMAPCAASVCGKCGTRHNGFAAEDVISWLVKSVLGMMLGSIHLLA